jgi:hypothetical protein
MGLFASFGRKELQADPLAGGFDGTTCILG